MNGPFAYGLRFLVALFYEFQLSNSFKLKNVVFAGKKSVKVCGSL